MIVQIMAEFSDLTLIILQFLIIIFLQLQIFPFHIGKDSVSKIGCQTDDSHVGYDTGGHAGPDRPGIVKWRQIDTAEDTHKRSDADEIDDDPGPVGKSVINLLERFTKKAIENRPEKDDGKEGQCGNHSICPQIFFRKK